MRKPQVRTSIFQKSLSKFELRKFSGFSLIELLVAITIGGVILAVVMGSYAAMTKTNLDLDRARQLQKEANFAVIRMADKIRYFPIKSCETNKLVLKKGEDNELAFNSATIDDLETLEMDGQRLFSSNIKVDKIAFDCKGLGENPAKIQPRVQIFLRISSKINPAISNWIRTTISSRIYQ